MEHSEPVLLSKWWQTPSAQAAMSRAKTQRTERLTRVKEEFEARKQAAVREVNEWKVNDNSIVLPVDCDAECGMVSQYRCYDDGSYRKVLDACHHTKRIPSREVIRAAVTEKEVK